MPEKTINHYYTDRQQEIYEDIQRGYPETPEGDYTCEQLFENKQHLESLFNQCEHSGTFTDAEYILFIETVRVEGI